MLRQAFERIGDKRLMEACRFPRLPASPVVVRPAGWSRRAPMTAESLRPNSHGLGAPGPSAPDPAS